MESQISQQKTTNSKYQYAWEMESLKIAVVDDELECRTKAIREIKRLIGNAYIKEYKSGDELLEQDERYDLIFLDIEMPGRDGFETATAYRGKYPQTLIALLTTHTEYWKKGYAVNVFRYLEKNNMREDIEETIYACSKIFSKSKLVEFTVPKMPNIRIRLDNILYIEASRPHIQIHTKKGIFMSYETMNAALEKVGEDGFVKCHRGYIVNLDEIKNFDEDTIYLKTGESIILSARKRKEFIDKYINYKFEHANG